MRSYSAIDHKYPRYVTKMLVENVRDLRGMKPHEFNIVRHLRVLDREVSSYEMARLSGIDQTTAMKYLRSGLRAGLITMRKGKNATNMPTLCWRAK